MEELNPCYVETNSLGLARKVNTCFTLFLVGYFLVFEKKAWNELVYLSLVGGVPGRGLKHRV